MASIIQIPESGKFRAQVRRKGFKTETRTFNRRALALTWATKRENAIEESIAHGLALPTEHTVFDAVHRYRKEVGKIKPIGRSKEYSLTRIEDRKDGLGTIKLCDLSPAQVVHYITHQRDISGVTATIEMSYLSGILTIARDLFDWPMREDVMRKSRAALNHLSRLGKSDERDRRPSADELVQLRQWFTEHSNSLTPDIFDFILDSCFRPPTEITGLRWSDLNIEDCTIRIRDRKDPRKKIGNDQIVPLRGRCMEIINRQPKIGDFIFPVNGKTWSSIFPRACKALGITDLRLYDLRHEAITRMVESKTLDLVEMMHVSGHKDAKTFKRYVQLRAKNLVGTR